MQAIRPNNFRFPVEKEKPKEKKVDTEDQWLANMAGYGGWAIFKKRVQAQIDLLDFSVTKMIAENATEAEIGKQVVINEKTKEIINGLIGSVEQTREELDKIEPEPGV